jgi:phosphoribosylamine--glycine ligase
MIEACIDGQLHSIGVKWYSGFAVCIVLASGGYPGIYRKGFPIYGIKDAESDSRVVVFHAGTAKVGNQLVTSGGRVLGVTATGLTLEGALQTAYQAAEKIHFKGMQYRKDIGQRSLALAREKGMTT